MVTKKKKTKMKMCENYRLFVFYLQENCSYERFAFYAEWFQEEAHLTRSFILYFFPLENGIEIVSKTFSEQKVNTHFEFFLPNATLL